MKYTTLPHPIFQAFHPPYGKLKSLTLHFFPILKSFSNLYIPLWSEKSFKFMVLRLLENTFVSQKIESVYSWSQAKLSSKFLPSPF